MLIYEKLYDCTYSNFKIYVKKHNLQVKEKLEGHPIFETLPTFKN